MGQPERIGPYQVLRLLGAGGMGVVYEARHTGLDRRVALKQLHRDVFDLRSIERFRREGRALARLRHPGVVVVHELGESEDGPYLVQDLVEGETLARVLERSGPLDPRTAARIVAELAGALEATHAEGILHRDLKPDNVILRPDGRPVLIDFGLVEDEQAERLTRTGEVLGTLGYLSPEQAAGTRGLDARSDVYGLGVVLYSLLTGRPPFEGGTLLQVVKRIQTEDPRWPIEVRPDEVPPGLDAICRRAMARDREQRPPSAQALGAELEGWLCSPPATVRPRRGIHALMALIVIGPTALLVTALALVPASPPDERPPPQAPAPVDSAPATPASPSHTAPEPVRPLWRRPSKPLRYELVLREQGSDINEMEFRIQLTLAPTKSPKGQLAFRAEFTAAACRMGFGNPGLPFDSSEPDPAHPLAALRALVKRSFEWSLDTSTGEVVRVNGFAELERAVLEQAREDGNHSLLADHRILSRVLTDDFMRAGLRALTCRGKTAPVVWRHRADGTHGPVPEQTAVVLPSLFSNYRGQVVCRGTSRYHGGRLVEAELIQTRPGAALPETAWSLRLLQPAR